MNEKILFVALLTIFGIGFAGILFREKASEVLEPLKYPISLRVGGMAGLLGGLYRPTTIKASEPLSLFAQNPFYLIDREFFTVARIF